MTWIAFRPRVADANPTLEQLANSIAQQCLAEAQRRLADSLEDRTPAEAAGYIRARVGDLVRASVAWRLDQRDLSAQPADALYELALAVLSQQVLQRAERRRNRSAA